jgi:RNA polymerase-binding transcription factor DksA
MKVDTTGEFKNALMNLREKLSQATTDSREETKRRAILSEVNAALDRLEEGTYGICSSCYLVIPRGDLLQQPYTAVCRQCKMRKPRQRVLHESPEPKAA